MNIEVLTTKEMSINTKTEICDLFYNVFKEKKTLETFEKQFEQNEFNYSYFGLVYENEKLIGSYAVIPFKFIYNNENIILAQAVDTMIDEKYRGNPFLLKKLSNAVYKKLTEDDINFVFGFPNDNIYLVRKRILKWQDIYNLDIYALPVKIGNIKPKLKLFNIINAFYIKLINLFVSSNKFDSNENYLIHKSYENKYLDYRFNESYKTITIGENLLCYYKIKEFNRIKTVFIMELPKLNKNNLEVSVKEISKREKNIDLITYFGHLDFKPKNLYKIPEKIKPKDTFMSGKILDKEKINEEIFDIRNWKVNLSNFDWI